MIRWVSDFFRYAISIFRTCRMDSDNDVLEHMRDHIRASKGEPVEPACIDSAAGLQSAHGMPSGPDSGIGTDRVPRVYFEPSNHETIDFAALADIAPLTRHILVLLVQYQMPSKEISRRFGISRRTVRRHLRKAIRRIATRQERRVP